jgi:hypothetical protein
MQTSQRIRLSVAIRKIVVLALILAGTVASPATQLKEARVTEVVKDVKLLPTGGASRPATVSDEVRDGTAVRTGVESRSELKFPDQTLARLGANTIFSFSEGTRSLNLQDGAMLLRVPKGAGGAKISSSAVTAAITGTTVMVETHRLTKKNKNSFINSLCWRVRHGRTAFPSRPARRVGPGESRADDHHAVGCEENSGGGGRRYPKDHAKLASNYGIRAVRERATDRL